ncbi:MAG TPA: hypothetical protein QGF02_00245 [Candidatus Babeliales bacterium]|nr:hypothetical protein [Candidatus Babeliales bacterium]
MKYIKKTLILFTFGFSICTMQAESRKTTKKINTAIAIGVTVGLLYYTTALYCNYKKFPKWSSRPLLK